MTTEHRFVPLAFERLPAAEMLARARAFEAELQRRRSVRHFASEPVDDAVLDLCIRAAGSAPSGAHRQPWTFVVVRDPDVKRRIRAAAEAEERETYAHRLNEEWRAALEPLGTDWRKPFLETAPALIVVFRQAYGIEESRRRTNYYTQESVGIATGFLIAALHHAGLATLTHTPSPMRFLNEILERPTNERPFLLLVVGYPAGDAVVPDIQRKELDEYVSWR